MKNKMLSQSIADQILSMITIEKQSAAGDKLPNELELSEELGVSRTTLREAIRILATYGILEIQHGMKHLYLYETGFITSSVLSICWIKNFTSFSPNVTSSCGDGTLGCWCTSRPNAIINKKSGGYMV